MKPNPEHITIDDNENKILQLLQELVLAPRIKAIEWSKITKQTPNMKIGYPGQHLASLITGVPGVRTGARGDDLLDGSEVKSCSRVDQLDTCKDCGQKVLRIEENCPHCDSTNIKRMDDSKWLFSIKSEEELKLLTETIDRVFLTIADYPNFEDDDFETIRFQAFEIWNNTERHKYFKVLMTNYYNKLFLKHIEKNPSKTPAPKNFWPYSYQFYLCNPVKVFQCTVTTANTNPDIKIDFYVEPQTDRETLIPESMPTSVLKKEEFNKIYESSDSNKLSSLLANGKSMEDLKKIYDKKSLDKRRLKETLPYLDEVNRSYLDLRDTDKVSEAKVAYVRRKKK